MNIISKLNLNKHPNVIENNSIIHAENIMLSEDGAVLQNEPICEINEIIKDIILEKYENNQINIIYSLPCNDEILFFIRKDSSDNTLDILRYNEKTNTAKIVLDNFEYSDGKLIGTFTYNKGELIISISEYFEDDSNAIPLRVLNLKTIDDDLQINADIHSIQPKVIIPTITHTYEQGLSYKGWYYIFIRYKIDTNNYTQWYNTNETVFIDTYETINILNYFVPKETTEGDEIGDGIVRRNTLTVSNESDISNLTFNLELTNLDNRYNNYQLGFICATKTNLKAFKTLDRNILDNAFLFSNKVVDNYNNFDLIKTYYNYFNIKSLDNINNRLYIANYTENNKEDTINTDDIVLTIKEKITNIGSDDSNSTKVSKVTNFLGKFKQSSFVAEAVIYEIDGEDVAFMDATQFIYTYGLFGSASSAILLGYKKTDKINFVYDFFTSTDSITDLAENILYEPIEKAFYHKSINSDGTITITKTHTVYGTNPAGISTINGEKVKGQTVMVNMLYDWEPQVKIFSKGVSDSIDVINSISIAPESYYNLFIHFVNEYGEITNGFPIYNFNVQLDAINNYIEYNSSTGFIYVKSINDSKLLLDIKLNNIPENYIGYFVSCEEFEKTIIYKGICKKDKSSNTKLYFYSDELLFADSINLNFDRIKIFNSTVEDENSDSDNIELLNKLYEKSNNFIEYNILDKKVNAPDSLNNILQSASLEITTETTISFDDSDESLYEIAYLYKSTVNDLYKNDNKKLIPVSPIIYDTTKSAEVNIKNTFLSNFHAIIFNTVYFNYANFTYQDLNGNISLKPFYIHKFKDYFEVPFESSQIYNKPAIVYFPRLGVGANGSYEVDTDTGVITSTINGYKQSYVVGSILESKNTVDLFKERQNNIYENHPKPLAWKNPNNDFNDLFPKTIRRSNVLQDESNTNNWRKFETDEYRNINENKGNIIKLIGIGKYFIVHTEHSMFLFNGTDTIKSDEGGISLASVDIMNLNYQEVTTSKLGYAGIQREHHGIVGAFGYIFYDKDSNILYRYDNDKLTVIDSEIKNFINAYKDYDVEFGDDKKRNRLFIVFKGWGTYAFTGVILSYNYLTNSFISLHNENTFSISVGANVYKLNNIKFFTTKCNSYIVASTYREDIGTGKPIFDLEEKIFNFSNSVYSKSNISIIYNNNYEIMKYLDCIIYKVNKIDISTSTDFLPVEGKYIHYAADSLQIYSEHCDTGVINIDTSKNLNSPDNYMTPYWRFGNWHFNAIRNKVTNNDLVADEKSRIFGNWFVVKFNFNTNQKVEIESLECKTSIAEY